MGYLLVHRTSVLSLWLLSGAVQSGLCGTHSGVGDVASVISQITVQSARLRCLLSFSAVPI